MIYLIRTTWYDLKNDKIIDLVKIGYTGNFDKRWEAYKAHNPLCTVLSTIEDGTDEDEKRLHYHFKNLIYPDYGKEWFKYDQSIIDFFNTHKTSSSLSSMSIKEKEEKIKSLTGDIILKNWLDSDECNCSDNVKMWLNNVYLKQGQFREKIRSFCETENLTEEDRNFLLTKLPIELPYTKYYTSLGPTRCKALSYNKNELEQELTILKFDVDLIKKRVISEFSIGDIIPLGEAKKKLQEIYNSLDYKKLAKSTDLNNFYETSNCKKRFSGKQIDCIKINKLK